ncbi:hypothetical protein SCATT_p06250 (plasmid) [Streptantibioticus cattleyicolor NRRL 8057 = DSM 46488]|uniref:Uncharacterized protein n=1 Tax=Streptantibioticus cattleyicolor (strain ATCC 35852 / DSM 46488 / JCM 4925 / NBRC 14057 / NRRL 8057) TaxID=1003195 RepID=G8XGZ1_STREN|nr:hypothetical protein SCATT_p06250 [Streptantibioticus cattleyicolor NRRL 8057 = DSM 46488]
MTAADFTDRAGARLGRDIVRHGTGRTSRVTGNPVLNRAEGNWFG